MDSSYEYPPMKPLFGSFMSLVFSCRHATLHLAVSVGPPIHRSVCPFVPLFVTIFKAVFASLPLPILPRCWRRLFSLVRISLYIGHDGNPPLTDKNSGSLDIRHIGFQLYDFKIDKGRIHSYQCRGWAGAVMKKD